MTYTACTIILILAAKFYIVFLVAVSVSYRPICFMHQVYKDNSLLSIKICKNNLFAVILRYDSARFACVLAWLNVFSVILVMKITQFLLIYHCETVTGSHLLAFIALKG